MGYTKINSLRLNDVRLNDAYLVNAFNKEIAYLTGFDTDRLLAGFRETAGVDMRGARPYPGWERLLIGGHTLGHYLTACAQGFESANSTDDQKEQLLVIMERLAAGLKECQDAYKTGFIFGAQILDPKNVELQFDNVEQGKCQLFTESWVPWYTMHKIITGLNAMADLRYTGDDAVTAKRVKALKSVSLKIVSRLADWTYARIKGWTGQIHRTVLSIEYGGMNDCLYDTYLLTGKKQHLAAAHAFDDKELFERIKSAKAGDDVLNNIHANTTIPKFMGALKRYAVTGEKEYFEYAHAFWTLVTEQHTYITGGNSEGEHFGRDSILAAELSNTNCETCNAYNMQKMAKLFHEITGLSVYADWDENIMINSILASQNPATGMTTYFQPMETGYFKVYSRPYTNFWCCTGTGMENFTKLGNSMFFAGDRSAVIDKYFASHLKSEHIDLVVDSRILSGDGNVRITLKSDYKGTLMFRIPGWASGEMSVRVDGVLTSCEIAGCDSESGSRGYAVLTGKYKAGTVIDLDLPMSVVAHNLPDDHDMYAFTYGPVLLSAKLGSERMETGPNGVEVRVPAEKIIGSEFIPSQTNLVHITDKVADVDEFMQNIGKYMALDAESAEMKFKLLGTDAKLSFVGHYSVHERRYGIYINFKLA